MKKLLLIGRIFHLVCISAILCPAQSVNKPNILFIFSDDHDQAAISAYGNSHINTPNIDRIAQKGVVFQNSFCTNSICAPSRAVILTGKHSHLNGVRNNQFDTRFDSSQVTFPKLLQKAGYQTALIGKWHLKSNPTGFHHWEIHNDQGQYYNPEFITENGIKIREGYATDITADLTLEYLSNRDTTKPFLMMMQFKAPHRNFMPKIEHIGRFDSVKFKLPNSFHKNYNTMGTAANEHEMGIDAHMMPIYDLKLMPAIANSLSISGIRNADPYFNWMCEAVRLQPKDIERWVNAYMPRQMEALKLPKDEKAIAEWKYQAYMRDYMACVYSVDENVGRVLDYLQKTGLDKNTIVVYSSDQGFWLGENGWFDKRWMYDKSMRMPLIIQWPGVTNRASKSAALVQNLDYAPTFLEMAGVKIPADIQGKSLVPLLKNPTANWNREALYYEYFEYPHPHRVQPHYGIRTATHKLIYFPLCKEWEFYDLITDPEEQNNLIKSKTHQKTVAELKNKLAQLRKYYKVP